MKNRLLAMLAIAGLMAALGTPWAAMAQVPPRPVPASPAPTAREVTVELMVVHANNDHARVDARLGSLRAHFQHYTYTGYDVLQTQSESLSDGQEARYTVVGGREIKVELVDHDGDNARLRIRMFTGDRKVLDTTVSVRRNRSFIVTGPSHENGVLILPITAQY